MNLSRRLLKLIPRMTAICKKLADGLTFKKILLILLGAMICTFGIHNIHQRTNITEGGVIGLMLLVEHWLKISPAYITPMLDAACYLLAFKFLGGNFIKISIISTLFVSVFYKIWELLPPMLPDLSAHPLIAAVLGGSFCGCRRRLNCSSGRFQWWRWRLGFNNFSRLPLEVIPFLFVHGYCSAAIIPYLYSHNAYCFLIDNRYCFFELNRLDKEYNLNHQMNIQSQKRQILSVFPPSLWQ